MNIENFVDIIGADFYTGVPDSQLKSLCNYLEDVYGIDKHHHIIAANEGNAAAIAAGYYLATGKIPVVYMQNSGQGNIINPLASLLSDEVYAIPAIFVIGWRGEPNVHDEPQHIYQGKVTLKLLDDMDIAYSVISSETTVDYLKSVVNKFSDILKTGKSVAFVIKKGALTYDKKVEYKNDNLLKREDAIEHIVKYSQGCPIISTTGKASRELFEIRERNNQEHKYDFLTVGSMGHTSSIALGVALNTPNKKVLCLDGDGSMIMHMGSLAVVGTIKPENLVHIVINNSAHETVGGMPTVAGSFDVCALAKACGYQYVASVNNTDDLDKEMISLMNNNVLSFLEVKCSISSRSDLGRPTTKPIDNKKHFMNFIIND